VIGDILQPTHLLFVLVIALLVLGPKRLPEVGRSLGRGIRDFRGALTGDDQDDPEIPQRSQYTPPATPPADSAFAQPAPATAPAPSATEAPPAPANGATESHPSAEAVHPAGIEQPPADTHSAAEAVHPAGADSAPTQAQPVEPAEQHVG
jgi:sec-independent protein translocase protein TatA